MPVQFHRSGLTNAWRHDPLVVVGVDTHRVALEVERILAVLNMLQLVLVQVRPSPDARINYMWEPFPASDLQTPIKCPLDRDAFAGMRPVCGDGGDQRVQLVPLLFQLLHQRFNGALRETLGLAPLLNIVEKNKMPLKSDVNKIQAGTYAVTHETVHDA